LEHKASFDEDSTDLRQFKGLIRKAEARASSHILCLDPSKVLFLDLPFYEKGRYRQFKPSDEDVFALKNLCERIQPHQMYLTGSGAEPNSVAGLSFQLVMQALAECSNQPWISDCQVWIYESIERPWSPHEIDMAVPLSPDELAMKLDCLYHHRSQRRQTPFLEKPSGESWQAAEHTNRATARRYDALGLAEYEAMEAFRSDRNVVARR
jgi:glucosamine-6-phosphate deaminase